MKLLVSIRPENGHFVASLPGDERLRAEGGTRENAISSLLILLDQTRTEEELIEVEWPRRGLLSLAGSVKGEAAEALREIVADAYRLRDEQKAAEFPQ